MSQIAGIPSLMRCVLMLVTVGVAAGGSSHGDVQAPSPRAFVGYKVGTTCYDVQHGGSMGRQIAVGADTRVHFVWTYKPDTGLDLANRSVRYNSAFYSVPPGSWVFSHSPNGLELAGAKAGYITLDVWSNRAVPAWHSAHEFKTYAALDFGSGSGSFTTKPAPHLDCNEEIGDFLWPVIDADDSLNLPIFHIVSTDNRDFFLKRLVYFRGRGSTMDWVPDCAEIIDEEVSVVSAVVREDPNSSEVTIVYARPIDKNWPTWNSRNNDIVYVRSDNWGLNWGTPVNITNYNANGWGRAYKNISALYDTQGCFHIVWDELEYSSKKTKPLRVPRRTRLQHWDDCNQCISTIRYAENQLPCRPDDDNGNLSKPNISECDGKLYVTYTYFPGDLNDPGSYDCSQRNFANADICVQVSETGGETWGRPVNLTNSQSHDCLLECRSENWPSTAMYSVDSLYIMYIGDRSAGAYFGGEGVGTENDVMFLTHPCFSMNAHAQLHSDPSDFADPFHGAPNSTLDTTFTLENTGSDASNYIVSITYTSGSGWLYISPMSGTVPAGCNNQEELYLTINAPSTEGLYRAQITITYSPAKEELVIPVDFYCFEEFYTPLDDAVIRTNQNKLNVRNASGVGNQQPEEEFYWWVDSTDYLFDGSLILATDRDNCNFNIFHEVGDEPLPANPWRELRALSPTYCDSTSYPYYRYAQGDGCTEDSTIAFTSKFYASKHPDSSGFYIAHFDIYAGPNWTTDINGLRIAYACDWDVPSDSGFDNSAGLLPHAQAVYQKGEYGGSPSNNDNRYSALAYRADDSAYFPADGGFVWNGDTYVYPDGGYHVDSLMRYIDQTAVTPYFILEIDTVPITDYSSITVVDRNAFVGAVDTISFSIIVATTNPNAKALYDLENEIAKAEQFICDYVAPDAPHCIGCPKCKCGDADSNGIWNISDAVRLIGYIFNGDPRPHRPCNGDADGNSIVNISDAIYIITYDFGGGPVPGGCDPCQEW